MLLVLHNNLWHGGNGIGGTKSDNTRALKRRRKRKSDEQVAELLAKATEVADANTPANQQQVQKLATEAERRNRLVIEADDELLILLTII